MEMFGVAVNVIFSVNASMKQWNTELTASNQRLGNVKIRREISQGDSLFPLLFLLLEYSTILYSILLLLAMIPLILMLRQTKASYDLNKESKKIIHLLFMDDLKLFVKNQDQIESLVNTVITFSEVIEMEIG